MPNTVSAEDVKAKLDGGRQTYIIDVLSPESYQEKHLPTAINIQNGPELVSQVEARGIPKDAEIIVYCSSETCGASPAAAETLEKAGFTNIAYYKDGLAGWQEAGYDFERPDNVAQSGQ